MLTISTIDNSFNSTPFNKEKEEYMINPHSMQVSNFPETLLSIHKISTLKPISWLGLITNYGVETVT